MSKKKVLIIIALSVITGWVFSIFPGRFLEAKVSTWPVLNKWKILSPQAPIVINTRETVRVSDSGDAVSAVSQVKSKLSLVILTNNEQETVLGSAINLTSDGVFVTSQKTFGQKPQGGIYHVVLNDGTHAEVVQMVTDPATDLTFFKADLRSVPVVTLASSKNMSAGDKVVFVKSSLVPFNVKSQISFVNVTQNDVAGKIFNSDYPARGFTAQNLGSILEGEAVINTQGEVVGIWSDARIVSSDIVKQSQSLYFANPSSILRPSFGFSYSVVGKVESSLFGLPTGFLVKGVEANLPAQKSGLLSGDLIIEVNGQAPANLEEVLQNFKASDSVVLKILRKDQEQNLTLKLSQLK